MPVNIIDEAKWLARLFKRPAYITSRNRKNGATTRYRIPYKGKPEWEPGEEAIQKINPDGTTTNVR